MHGSIKLEMNTDGFESVEINSPQLMAVIMLAALAHDVLKSLDELEYEDTKAIFLQSLQSFEEED